MLGFNDTSTLVGHFMSSPREREKRDRKDSREDEKEGQGKKRNRNESEETEAIKTFPLDPYLLQGYQALPNCKPISFGRPGDIRYMTHSHHPITHPPTNIFLQNGICKQCRPQSDCSWRSSLIRIYTVCHSTMYCKKQLREKSKRYGINVQNFRTFTN